MYNKLGQSTANNSDLVLNGSIGNSSPMTGKSKVETSLGILSNRIDRFQSLTEEIIDLIQYPQPVPCYPDEEKSNQTPTLYQIIERLDARVDDANQRLAIAIEVIKENLGDIKLD